MDIELRHLRYFVAVAEERHFGRAATRLRIAQPGLSKQIKRLEESLGVTLLIRDKRHVEMTAAGEVFLDRARLTLEMAGRAIESVRRVIPGQTGTIRLGGLGLSFYPELQKVINEFSRRFPPVEVVFLPTDATLMMDSLVRRQIDAAIVYASPDLDSAEFVYCPIATTEPAVVVAATHRLAALDVVPLDELLTETVFMWSRDLNPQSMDRLRASLFGSGPETPTEVATIVELLARVGAGEGIGIFNPGVDALALSNIVTRKFEAAPVFEYGFASPASGSSSFLEDLLNVGRELAPQPP